jgi:GxxExxY protein
MTRDPNKITESIIGAAIEVHRELGPGLLESTYEACLAYELIERGLRIERQRILPVKYRGVNLDCVYRIDLLVEDFVIVELKVVEKLEAIHEAQLLSYLKLSGAPIGLLLNFNVIELRLGIRRLVNKLRKSRSRRASYTAEFEETAEKENRSHMISRETSRSEPAVAVRRVRFTAECAENAEGIVFSSFLPDEPRHSRACESEESRGPTILAAAHTSVRRFFLSAHSAISAVNPACRPSACSTLDSKQQGDPCSSNNVKTALR